MKLGNKVLNKQDQELWERFSHEIVYGDLLKFMFKVTTSEKYGKSLEHISPALYDRCIAWFELYKIIEDEAHDLIDTQAE